MLMKPLDGVVWRKDAWKAEVPYVRPLVYRGAGAGDGQFRLPNVRPFRRLLLVVPWGPSNRQV